MDNIINGAKHESLVKGETYYTVKENLITSHSRYLTYFNTAHSQF